MPYFDTLMLEKITLRCSKNVMGKRKKTQKTQNRVARTALHKPGAARPLTTRSNQAVIRTSASSSKERIR